MKPYMTKDEICMRYRDGASVSILAQLNACNTSVIRQILGVKAKDACAERMELYEGGLTDAEIAEEIGLTVKAIISWRRKEGLLPNRRNNTQEEHLKRLALYNQGLNDRQVAEALGMLTDAIYAWRRRNGIPAHQKKAPPDTQRRKEMCEKGLTVKEMADAEGVSENAMREWLKRQELENGGKKKKHMQRLELYNQGLNDREIAEAVGRSTNTICAWRKNHNLPVNEPKEGAVHE